MDSISEIKARLSIEDLVREYCAVQQKGRTLKAVCPFHHDTHPSLLISPQKGIAYCFACQSGGDIFSFYQKIENVSFSEALRGLAEKTGVTLPKEKPESVPRDAKERLRSCLEAATRIFSEAIWKSDTAKEYLSERQVTHALISEFRIGFAPDSFDATYTQLLKLGFSKKEILAAGLGVQKDLHEERMYDRFRNRIMFPITDTQGNLIGFGGRLLPKAASAVADASAKYINSPDGPLYNKSTALFGLSHAKESIREEKSIILVEGYFDVLACHRVGIKNVVAVSGTALTEQHVLLLKRYSSKIILCLDADRAGMEAAERAYLLSRKQDLLVHVVTLPQGKDPDECAMKDPDGLRMSLKSAGIPYLTHVFEKFQEAPPEKRDAVRRILPLIQCIPSAVEREAALEEAAQALQSTVTALQDDLRRMQEPSPAPATHSQTALAPFSTTELFLGLLLKHPVHLPLAEKLIEPEAISERALHDALRLLPAIPVRELLLPALPPECKERASILLLYCEEHFGTWSDDLAGKELRKLLQKANRDLLTEKQKHLVERIREARRGGKKMEEEQLLTQYQKVLRLTALAR